MPVCSGDGYEDLEKIVAVLMQMQLCIVMAIGKSGKDTALLTAEKEAWKEKTSSLI